MSDLHNLSAPIEETQEEISEKEIKIKQIQKTEVKENFKKLSEDFIRRYKKKVLLSIGIAVTVCIILAFILTKIFSPAVDDWPENKQDTPKEETPVNQETSVKYTKFDGHQYYFYFPEEYGFLDRTRNDDLNEVVFSYKDGGTAFLLQEFEADNDDETTLDSIYSYIATTLPPDENTEVKIGENTFKRRVYKECKPKDQETLDAEAETGETLPMSVTCALGIVYYSAYINGVVVIFGDMVNTPGHMDDQSVLKTFAKNIIDPQVLSEEYISAKLPTVKNKLQAHFAFGVPIKTEEKADNITEISWQTNVKSKILLGFDSSKAITYSHGLYNDKFKYNLEDGISDSIVGASHKNITTNQVVLVETLKANPDAVFFMDDHVPDDNLWEIKVMSSFEDDAILIAEYTIDKTTGQVKNLND